MTKELSLKEDWMNSDVCDELKYNLEGTSRNEDIERRQEDVARWWMDKIYTNLMAMEGEIEVMRRELNRYFNK